ncbi:MAG TPA: transferrin receptor-like dimerization domain-containing protein [Steroidobacteraceae bacterium]|jgi:N-acetylated-alpha-linked acidic dipeptidase|nr:transferrin receptor-like dimerization domain-containing protein [Steroidobacteraceae bacterium]
MSPAVTRTLKVALSCFSLAWVTAAAAMPGSSSVPAGPQMLGFTPPGAAQERDLEQRFDAQLSAAEMREWLRQLSSEPNQVGSPHDKANADFLLAQFRKWGWNAHIEVFDVLYPTPKQELVEMVAPTLFRATLHEPPVKDDRTSALGGVLPPYNVYGADGDVTAPLVYVNYGMPDDYKELARYGISVKGKIVIVRYGHGWRGLKPQLAYEHGAVGCLIYSDPRDDGYFNGDSYPKGGWRPPEGVQRGSVMNIRLYPGDPTTPGYGSVPGAKHLPVKDSASILEIPVLPISYADATPLLQALGGPVAPAGWRGALPLTYHLGSGPAQVHLMVKSDWSLKPIYDVIARLKGSTDRDQWVIRGNHHDGWVFGAWDPLAGTVALMGEAKGLGALHRRGWRPERTIVYASWDGEEPMLLGSTEWAETHARELQQKAVLYLNSDTNARGFLSVGGSHSLQHMVNQVAAGVIDPETKVSLQQRERALMELNGAEPDSSPLDRQLAALAAGGGDLPLSALGSGSDFSPFLDHLGLPTLHVEFGGEDADDGIYHSRYDSFDHFIRFGDPTFAYEVALAQVAGHIVMRTADAQVLPMRFVDFSATLDRYVKGLHQEVDAERKAAQRQHKLLDASAYALTADPTQPVEPPERLPDVPNIDLAPLDQAAQRLRQSAAAYESAYAARAAAGLSIPGSQLREINDLMATLEQRLLDAAGLPGRPWYKNVMQAPGLMTGYAPKTIPAVREALEAHNWNGAGQSAAATAKVLDGYRMQLDRITAMLAATGR